MQNSWFILNGDIILLQSVEVYTLPELKCPHWLQQEYSSLSSACLKYAFFFYYTPNFHFRLHMHWYLCSNLCEHTLVILIFPHSFCLFVLSIRMREWWNHWGWERPKSSFLNTIGGNIYSSFIIKNVVWERNNKRNKNNWKL